MLLFYKSTTVKLVKLFLQLKIPNAQKKPNKNCSLFIPSIHMILRGKRKRNKSNNYSFIINNKNYKNHNTKCYFGSNILFKKHTLFYTSVSCSNTCCSESVCFHLCSCNLYGGSKSHPRAGVLTILSYCSIFFLLFRDKCGREIVTSTLHCQRDTMNLLDECVHKYVHYF